MRNEKCGMRNELVGKAERGVLSGMRNAEYGIDHEFKI
jgi:hypothetical protein